MIRVLSPLVLAAFTASALAGVHCSVAGAGTGAAPEAAVHAPTAHSHHGHGGEAEPNGDDSPAGEHAPDHCGASMHCTSIASALPGADVPDGLLSPSRSPVEPRVRHVAPLLSSESPPPRSAA